MKSIIIAAATMFFFCSANAQSGSVPIAKIQKLLDKAEGQKYVDVSGREEKITKQEITENTYTLYYTDLGKYGSKWVVESTNIQWEKGFNHYSMGGYGNNKITICKFDFENELNWYMHVQDETGTPKSARKSLEFFILTKDYAEFEALIKQ